jgi:hypothetical protein
MDTDKRDRELEAALDRAIATISLRNPSLGREIAGQAPLEYGPIASAAGRY